MEQSVRALCPRHVLLRFGWLLDDSSDGLLGRFLQRLEQSEELCLADDRRGNPTPVEDAARVILAVLKQLDCQAPLWGTYHYGGHEASTPLVVGQALLTEAARSSLAQESAIDTAKVLAITACDLLENPDRVEAVLAEYAERDV